VLGCYLALVRGMLPCYSANPPHPRFPMTASRAAQRGRTVFPALCTRGCRFVLDLRRNPLLLSYRDSGSTAVAVCATRFSTRRIALSTDGGILVQAYPSITCTLAYTCTGVIPSAALWTGTDIVVGFDQWDQCGLTLHA
jgi:hypothetical protein